MTPEEKALKWLEANPSKRYLASADADIDAFTDAYNAGKNPEGISNQDDYEAIHYAHTNGLLDKYYQRNPDSKWADGGDRSDEYMLKPAPEQPKAAGENPATTTTTAPEVDETRKAIEEGYRQQEAGINDILLQMNADMKAAEERDLAQQKAYQKAAAWTGAGELAAGLANLIGVGAFGSAHQQYNNFSKDWMAKADEERKTRVARSDKMKDQLRTLNAQIAALKSGKATALANYDIKKRQADIQQQRADAQNAYYVARSEVSVAQAELKELEVELKEAKIAGEWAKADKLNADIEAKKADVKTKQQRANSYAALVGSQVTRNIAQANYYDRGGRASNSTTGGTTSGVPGSSAVVGTNGLPIANP